MYNSFLKAFSIVKRTSAGDIEIKVELANHNAYAQAKHWCTIEFGRESVISRPGKWWCYTDWSNWYVFCFNNETDAMAFKLAWS